MSDDDLQLLTSYIRRYGTIGQARTACQRDGAGEYPFPVWAKALMAAARDPQPAPEPILRNDRTREHFGKNRHRLTGLTDPEDPQCAQPVGRGRCQNLRIAVSAYCRDHDHIQPR